MSMKLSTTLMSLMTLLVVAPVFAEEPLKATIPFDFTIGSTHLGAGDYMVTFDSGVMRLRRDDNKAFCNVLTNPVQAKKTPSEGKLVFNKYGNRYFLAQIWSPGHVRGRQLLKGKSEKEFASNLSSVPQTSILASAAYNRPFLR